MVGKAIGEMVQVKGSEGCAGVEQVTSVLVKAIRLAEEPLRRRYSSLLLRGLPLDFLSSPRAFCRYDSRTGIYQVVSYSTRAWSEESQTNEQDTVVSFEGAQ